MVFISPLSTPIPITSIPTFVFQSPAEPLPDHPIFISLDNPKRLTLSTKDYRLLSQRFALGLKDRGLQDGDKVLLADENSVYFPVVFMGTLMAGGVFVGVQKSNSSYDLLYKIEQTDPRVMLLSNENMDRVDDILRAGHYIADQIFYFDEDLTNSNGLTSHWSTLLAVEESAKDFQWPVFHTKEDADQNASLIYSSGTSGKFKAVEMSHYQIVASVAQNSAYSKARVDTELLQGLTGKPFLAYASYAQVLAQISTCVHFPRLRAPSYITAKRDFLSIQGFVIKLQLPILIVYPSFIVALMKSDEIRKRIPEMRSLKIIMLTGGPISDTLCKQFIQLWHDTVGQPLHVRVAYGMTEIGGRVYTRAIGVSKQSLADNLLPNTELKITNWDGTKELEVGEEGEIWFRGPNVAKGYWREPEYTAEIFVEMGWVRTGDVGMVDASGALIVNGRLKDLIGSRTQQITPLEIEEVLLLHPDIENAVICKIQDLTYTGEQLARAYIVKREGANLDAQAVHDFLMSNAPHLPALNGGVSFPLSIPVVSNHKPEREVLVARDPELAR